MEAPGMPQAQGLYDPQREHDACGVGFIVQLKGKRSHQIVLDGLTALANLEHRGASGSEANTGDGAGILIQVPDAFFRHELAAQGIRLPEAGHYGVGQLVLQSDELAARQVRAMFQTIVQEEGQHFLGWRVVPTDADAADVGPSARAVEPTMFQAFVGRDAELTGDDDVFERKLWVIRKCFEKAVERSGL